MNKNISLVIAIIATAVLVGGGMFYLLSNKATIEKNNLQVQIDQLNSKFNNQNEGSTKNKDTREPIIKNQDDTQAGIESDIFSINNLKNAYYTIGDKQFKLTDGKYNNGKSVNSLDYFSAIIDENFIAKNTDTSRQEVAVVIITSVGGTGSFHNLVVVGNKGGKPQHIANKFIEDRIQEKTINFSGDKITIKALVHGQNDPSCCPSLEKTFVYKLTLDNKLLEIK